MISERLGTYILYIFMIIYSGLLYSDLKKIWNLKHMVRKLLIYIIFILSIWNIACRIPTLGHIYDKNTGTLQEFYLMSTSRKGIDRDQYAIIIQNQKNGKLEKYKYVPVDYEYDLKKGMQLEIYSFGKKLFPSYQIAKINGKRPQYFIERYRMRPYEREFSFSLMSIYALVLLALTRKEYIANKKQYGKLWYWLCAVSLALYGGIPWILYNIPDYGCQVRKYVSIIFLLLSIFELLFSRVIGKAEYQTEWKLRNQQLAKEAAEQQRIDEKDEKMRQKRQLILETDNVTEHQFQQMSYYMTKQYCDYKFQKRMKNSIEGVAVIAVLELVAAFVIPAMCDKLFKWYGYVAGAGVIIAILIFAVGYVLICRKKRKFKEVANAGYPLEYCIVVADVYNLKKFICSDGHMEEWKMKPDDDAKVKDGEDAVVIYSPATHEMFTERKEVMNKICGI